MAVYAVGSHGSNGSLEGIVLHLRDNLRVIDPSITRVLGVKRQGKQDWRGLSRSDNAGAKCWLSVLCRCSLSGTTVACQTCGWPALTVSTDAQRRFAADDPDNAPTSAWCTGYAAACHRCPAKTTRR